MIYYTKNLTGPALNWAVGIAAKAGYSDLIHAVLTKYFSPSTDWSIGGPIIEREGIELLCNLTAKEAEGFIEGTTADWRAAKRPINRNTRYFGTTPLIAAMRCYVASRLGDEVEVPEELA